MIKYHSICRNHHELLCFFDSVYLCTCDEPHLQAECFNYDHTSDQCDRCFANGRCLKGRNDSDVLCICPACHGGRLCQFNFESFSVSIDQLFFSNLLSANRVIRQAAYYLLLITSLTVWLTGLANNLCCFVTFQRPRCLRNGTGHYLYCMSICNQWNLTCLAVRLIHLTLNITASHSSPSVNSGLCKTSNYLLTTSTRLTYWLGSLIAIERVYVAWFVNGQWLKKPHIARRIIALTVLTILVVSAYEWAFIHSQISSDDGSHAMCAITFPTGSPVWFKVHTAVTIIDSLVPFTINLLCTVAIICLVTKKRMNATARDRRAVRQTRLQLLRSVLVENKELVIGPAFTLLPQLFSLPYFIASLTLRCQNLQSSRLRYLLTVSYLARFVPQLMSFVLYISPSSFYCQEWRATKIYQWIMKATGRQRGTQAATRTANVEPSAR